MPPAEPAAGGTRPRDRKAGPAAASAESGADPGAGRRDQKPAQRDAPEDTPQAGEERTESPATKPAPASGRAPGRRRRRRGFGRVLLILFVVLLLLAVGVAIAAELVRRSDLPRSIAQDAAQSMTGLRVEIGGLDLTWGGVTEVRGLVVRLPLSDEPVLDVALIRAEHANIAQIAVGVLAGTGVRVDSVLVRSPRLYVEQDEFGQWNVQRLASRLAAALGGGADNGGPRGVPSLPRITVQDGRVDLTAGGASESIRFSVRGGPEHRLAYGLEAVLEGIGTARARVGVGATWEHDAVFDLTLPEGLLALFAPDAGPFHAAGRWTGSLVDGSFRGELDLAGAGYGQMAARGKIGLAMVPGGPDAEAGVRIIPTNLGVTGDGDELIHLLSGQLLLRGDEILLDRLHVRTAGAAAGIDAQLDGVWRLTDDGGALTATWHGRAADVRHRGTAELGVRLGVAGRNVVAGCVEAELDAPEGSLDVAADLDLSGPDWERFAAKLAFSRLTWEDDEGRIDLAGTRAGLERRGALVRLTDLRVPLAGASAAYAQFDAATGAWAASLEAYELELPRVEVGPVRLSLQAAGEGPTAETWDLRVSGAGFALAASGAYDAWAEYTEAGPGAAPLTARASVDLDFDARPAPPEFTGERLSGRAALSMELAGTLRPIALSGRTAIATGSIAHGRTRLDDLSIDGVSTVDGAGFRFQSERFEVLDGAAELAGSAGRDGTIRVQVIGEGLELEEVARMLAIEQTLGGLVDADLLAELPGGDVSRTRVQGRWRVADLAAGPLVVAEGQGRIRGRDALIVLEDVELLERPAGGEAGGRVGGRATFDLAGRRRLTVDLEASRWPVQFAGGHAVLDGALAGGVDVVDLVADLSAALDGDLTYGQTPAGRFRARAGVLGRVIEARQLDAEVAGGTLSGVARVDLNEWQQSTADLEFEGIDLGELVGIFRPVPELRGVCSGTVRLARAGDPRAMAPMRVDADLTVENGGFNKMTIEGLELVAHLGPARNVIDRARARFAGGVVDVWAGTSMHGTERYVQVGADIENLDLNELVHAAMDHDDRYPGRVRGRFLAGGYTASPHRLFGEADLALEASDLVAVPGIAQLYDAMNIRIGPVDPTGEGDVRVRLEGEALEISRMRYFNRGVDVIAGFRVDELPRGRESPIEGFAAGTVRPLRGIGLPFVGDLDRMLVGLQAGATTVRMSGTLEQIRTSVVPFAEVSGAVRRLFGRQEE